MYLAMAIGLVFRWLRGDRDPARPSRQRRAASAEIICDFMSCAAAGPRQTRCFKRKCPRRSFARRE